MSSPVRLAETRAPHEAALSFLYGRVDFERILSMAGRHEFKLDRMRQLLQRLGHPEQGLPIVHVAGTKGKGSTSATIAAILSAAGYRVGAFTSPHLDRIEERLAIDGQPCSADDLVELVRRVRPVVAEMDAETPAGEPDGNRPTYFEIATAMALLFFAARKVDAAVLEVGMGGRLDSTNVCQPRVAVITSISLDHTRQLGSTLAEIAREKAGIIKPGVPVVSGAVAPEAAAVIREVCRQQGAPLAELGTDFVFRYLPPLHLQRRPALGRLHFQWLSGSVPGDCPNFRGEARENGTVPFTPKGQPPAAGEHCDLELALPGEHQAANAAVALASISLLQREGWSVPETAIRAALASLRWPARIEVLARRPAIIIDAAHNVASIEALGQTLATSFDVRRRLLLFATTRDKDVAGMLRLLLGWFDPVVLTRYSKNPRAVPPQELAAIARELTGRDYPIYDDPAEAWQALRSLAGPDDLLCVTGSFFIAAEIRRLL